MLVGVGLYSFVEVTFGFDFFHFCVGSEFYARRMELRPVQPGQGHNNRSAEPLCEPVLLWLCASVGW